MTPLSFEHTEAAEQFAHQAAEFVSTARSLSDMELLAPSLCHGWSALDLVVHVRTGLEEMVIGAARTLSEPDHDAASYWSKDPGDEDTDPVPHPLAPPGRSRLRTTLGGRETS
ncbi:maleylpyruvate isomerase N-terminal domain-containing protein [Nocardioides sp. 1609]|uniref:maleylpyruvate isomerase N-terminal domain-containing protein n=1 Tax=Nocardioides sp. 1609 TaxID=2508327 RepID=UPI00106FC7B1|nr:maleylpyruvate isomerase N-terminal domain-containing protein [Nocardioides sp. 1609]